MESKSSQKLVDGIKLFFSEASKKKAVLGLSGGIDSSLVCVLLAKALGPKNVTGLIMPFRGISSAQNVSDAKKLAESLGVKAIVQEITPFMRPFSKTRWKQSKTAKTNLMPRIRAVLLYNYANSNDCLVVGTGNRTEIALGYFTKYGDGASDFFPIGGLWKTQVFELAAELEVPKQIVSKIPTAELWKGQSDEKELGLTYKEMDAILSRLFDEGKSPKELEQEGFLGQNIQRLVERMTQNSHKQKAPPSLKV